MAFIARATIIGRDELRSEWREAVEMVPVPSRGGCRPEIDTFQRLGPSSLFEASGSAGPGSPRLTSGIFDGGVTQGKSVRQLPGTTPSSIR